MLAGFLSCQFFDLSYDGQVYHQEAVITLAAGWNPVTEILTAAKANAYIYINHYSRGPWVYEAVVYHFSSFIGAGKLFNILLALGTFFIVLAALLKSNRLNNFWAVTGAFLLAFNPVSICQVLSFYIDGHLAAVLTALFATYYLLFKNYSKIYLVLLAAEIILLFNIKFTGVVYCLASLAIFIIWLILKKKSYWKRIGHVYSHSCDYCWYNAWPKSLFI